MILEKGEHIVVEVRKHWFLYVGRILPLILAVFVPPIVVGGVWISGYGSLYITEFSLSLSLFVYCIFLLILWVSAFVHWTDHYLDMWIVTHSRIVDIDQRGLFNREITSMRLDRVQDVTVEVPGFLATLFNFGNLQVQSAGDVQELIIRGVHNPVDVKEILTRQVTKVREQPREVTMVNEEK